MNVITAAKPTIVVPELVIVSANEIKTAAIHWLWPDVIALGMTNLFTGNPDQCKSLMIVDIAARASRGADWLDGGKNVNGPMDVLMMFNEDPAPNVVVPRLTAAGADLKRIHFLDHVNTNAGKVREFSIASDINKLEEFLEEHPSIKLIVIDPFSAYFGSHKKLNDDQTVRDVTAPLIQLAEQTRVAILDNSHLNKTPELDAIQKVIGAMAVVAIHRMAWVFTSAGNQNDRSERMMLPLKHNITAKADGIKFSVESVPVRLDDGSVTTQPHIVHKGTVDLTAQESMGMTAEQKTQLQDVIEILEEEFCDPTPKDAEPIIERIKKEEQNCSDSLIRKARKAAGVQTKKVGKRWQWLRLDPLPAEKV